MTTAAPTADHAPRESVRRGGRPGSDAASVGVVAWTGYAGWVAASPVQYFVSGAGCPDLILFTAETLRSGTNGVRAIGWFGNDWSLERGDFVWNDGPRN